MKCQNSEILDYLNLGNTLTPVEAKILFGCQRLAARIYDLRKIGVEIIDWMVKVWTRRGWAHVKCYSLLGIEK